MVQFTSYTYASNRDPIHTTVSELKPISDHEITIKVYATSLNPVDIILYNSAYCPLSKLNNKQGVGRDYAGVIDAIGVEAAANTGLKVGDRVCGMYTHPFGTGTIAEYLQLDPRKDSTIAKIPDSWSFEQGAALPLVYGTADHMMSGHELKGAKVLILGGATSVGRYLIQLAKLRGATSIVTSNGARSNELVQLLGLTKQIDYHKDPNLLNPVLEQAKEGKFNYIYDCAGNDDLFGQMDHILDSKKNGYVSIVGDRHYSYTEDHALSLSWVSAKGLVRLIRLKLGLLGYSYLFTLVPPGKWIEQGVKLVDEGKIKQFIDKVYPFEETPKAFDQLRNGAALGKVVIKVREL